MNGGQIIANTLLQHGIRHLFTLCGGHISPIYVEAERAGIKIIDVRNEASAVYGADALARLGGVPGVAAVTAGPGVTNSVTALKNAQLAQSPLLLIGGATATLLRNRGALQDIDQLSLVRSLVKWSARIDRKSQLAPLLSEALLRSQSNVPGPVFLECPVDLLYEEATVREWYGHNRRAPATLSGKLRQWYISRHLDRLFAGPEPEPSHHSNLKYLASSISARDVNSTVRQLQNAQQPVLLIGSGGMMLPDRVDRIAGAVGRLGIPTYLSGMARGLMGRNNELHYRHKRRDALREADFILLAGVPCDFRLDYGRHLNRAAKKIAISRSRQDLKKNLRADKTLRVDPGQFLIELGNAATTLPRWKDWKAALKVREEGRDQEICRMAQQETGHINPLALLLQLENRIPDDSVLIVDGGDFAASASYTLRPRKPLAWLDPGVYGTLGVGGGFALGAALHYPGDYIWVIYGDGSAAYSLTEFDTFTKMGMKVCAIVGNNGSWQQIARDQIEMLGSDTATVLPQSDYQLVAQAFGAGGERVETLEGFEAAMERALISMDKGIPYLINAVIGSTDFRKGSISM